MKKPPARECEKIFFDLCERLGEDTGSANCRTIRQHLRACADCRAYLASLRKTIDLYRRYPEPRLTAAAHRNLLRVLRSRT